MLSGQHQANENKILSAEKVLPATVPQQVYDDIACLAAYICNTPVSFIGLSDERRQWFKAGYGLPVAQISTNETFFRNTMQAPEIILVPDILQDARFTQYTFSAADRPIRFYAGVPVLSAAGIVTGTIAVMDYKPGALNGNQVFGLQVLARHVECQLSLAEKTTALQRCNAGTTANRENELTAFSTQRSGLPQVKNETAAKTLRPAATGADTLYSLSGLRSLSQGDEIFVKKLVRLFIAQTPSQVAAMEGKFLQADYKSMGSIAHAIKPVIDNLEIFSLKELIREVEKRGKEETGDPALREMIQAIKKTIHLVAEDLNNQYPEKPDD